MSLYRQAGGRDRRVLAGALLGGLLVGLLVGYLAGRGSVEEPSAAEVIAEARAELRPVAAGLELVPIEYEGAVSAGEVAAPTEYQAAQSAVARAEAALAASAEDLRAIDAATYAAAEQAVADLSEAIDSRAPPTEIETLASKAGSRVESLAAGSR